MKKYREFRPTQFDHHITIDNQENWYVAPVSRNRDSDILTKANWEALTGLIGPEGDDSYQIHRFGHWGPGWFEIILINPDNQELVKIGEEIEASLDCYPIIDEDLFYQMEDEEAGDIWATCYNDRTRLEYIGKHRGQFWFSDFMDLWTCAKGRFFAGDPGEIIG